MVGAAAGASGARPGAVQPVPERGRGKSLERDGLVSRTATATVPVTVVYAITPLGLTLTDTMDALRIWAETHIEDVLAAQARYDAAAA